MPPTSRTWSRTHPAPARAPGPSRRRRARPVARRRGAARRGSGASSGRRAARTGATVVRESISLAARTSVHSVRSVAGTAGRDTVGERPRRCRRRRGRRGRPRRARVSPDGSARTTVTSSVPPPKSNTTSSRPGSSRCPSTAAQYQPAATGSSTMVTAAETGDGGGLPQDVAPRRTPSDRRGQHHRARPRAAGECRLGCHPAQDAREQVGHRHRAVAEPHRTVVDAALRERLEARRVVGHQTFRVAAGVDDPATVEEDRRRQDR